MKISCTVKVDDFHHIDTIICDNLNIHDANTNYILICLIVLCVFYVLKVSFKLYRHRTTIFDSIFYRGSGYNTINLNETI